MGDRVKKIAGYCFDGEIRAVLTTRAGARRVVVELVNQQTGNGHGMLHIFSPDQIEVVK